MTNPISQAEYVKKECCPVCKGDVGVEGHQVDINDGQATQECFCPSCESTWTDVYTLTGYINLQDRDGFNLEVPSE